MKNITILIKPASSLCNMRCAYCFYADVASLREVRSYGVMSNETAHLLIDNVCANLSRDDEVTFVFQGGDAAASEAVPPANIAHSRSVATSEKYAFSKSRAISRYIRFVAAWFCKILQRAFSVVERAFRKRQIHQRKIF